MLFAAALGRDRMRFSARFVGASGLANGGVSGGLGAAGGGIFGFCRNETNFAQVGVDCWGCKAAAGAGAGMEVGFSDFDGTKPILRKRVWIVGVAR